MKTVKYKISIKGLPTPRGAISFGILRNVLEILIVGSERALRLAIEGESIKKGKPPHWLSQSADFVLTGIGKGSTTLDILAPILGEVAADQIQQQDLWYTVPDPNDTALTILSRSIHDTLSTELESDRYDPGVLDSLLDFKQILGNEKIQFVLTSKERRKENFRIDLHRFERIQSLRQSTPDPQAVILNGFFDTIEHSTRRFQLTMKNGQVVKGRINESMVKIEQMRHLWGKQVTMKGTLHYMASGKPRLFEAEMIRPPLEGESIFDTLQPRIVLSEMLIQSKRELGNQSIVSEIWGGWPGQESLEELLIALKHSESAR